MYSLSSFTRLYSSVFSKPTFLRIPFNLIS